MVEILVDRDVGQIPASISDKKKKKILKRAFWSEQIAALSIYFM